MTQRSGGSHLTRPFCARRKRQRPQGAEAWPGPPPVPGCHLRRPEHPSHHPALLSSAPLTEKLSEKNTLKSLASPLNLSLPVTVVSVHQQLKARGNGGRQVPEAPDLVPAAQAQTGLSRGRPPAPTRAPGAWESTAGHRLPGDGHGGPLGAASNPSPSPGAAALPPRCTRRCRRPRRALGEAGLGTTCGGRVCSANQQCQQSDRGPFTQLKRTAIDACRGARRTPGQGHALPSALPEHSECVARSDRTVGVAARPLLG